ncbi:MAG TPA: CopD family protein [Oscillatoriaceae cyanobacterium]
MGLPWGPAIARLVLLLGYTLMMGAIVLEGVVLPAVGAPQRHRRSGYAFWGGWGLMLVGSVLAIALLLLNLAGGDRTMALSLVGPLLTNLHGTGGVMVYRALLLLAFVLLGLVLRPFKPATGFAAGLLLATTLASDGHGADMGFVSWLAAIDTLHAFTAATWLGGLGLLWLTIPSIESARPAVEAFSRLATVCFPIAVLSGLVNAWIHLASHGGWHALFSSSPYVVELILKSALVFAILGLAAYLRQRYLPDWKRGAATGHSFRKHITVELSGGIVVLALTALLTQSAMPGEHMSARTAAIALLPRR